jgi:hypothetical protein
MASPPKRATVASLKKVSAENLANLGVERLAEILVAAAETRPDLKRRLRMELAAEQGADHLVLEIDKRLTSLDTSRSKVSWRKRASFVGDLDILRALIAGRLAALDPVLALDRLWSFMDLARRLGLRVKDRDGALAEVFLRAAGDIGTLAGGRADGGAAEALVHAIGQNPAAWTDWLPHVVERAPPAFVASALARLQMRDGGSPGLAGVLRVLADAADDVDAYRQTFSDAALRTPAVAAQVAQRLLAAGRVDAAGQLLTAARSASPADVDWESAWIDYLELSGQDAAAQDARWASFERTLSVERARAFVQRLSGFDDVEAETRAREYAARCPDLALGLRFLMEWPALPEAAAMIATRDEEIRVTPEEAELWAGRLRARQPTAAHSLLRKAAAAAFRRREFAICDRLTHEAETIDMG